MEARIYGYRCTKSPSAVCVFAEQNPSGNEIVFTAFDPLKGRGRELARFTTDPKGDYDWDISKDGHRIAIRKNEEARLDIISLKGEAPQELRVKGWSNLLNLDWAMDGKGIFTSGRMQRGFVLLYVDSKGNAHPLWEQRGSHGTWGIPSPDGHHLALSGWTVGANLWMMENF